MLAVINDVNVVLRFRESE